MSVATQSLSKPRRRVHSDAFKRELVQLSLAPGASVSALALENGINANLLFGWRKAHVKSQGADHADRSDEAIEPMLLPVEVVGSGSPPAAPTAVPARRGNSTPGIIEIELAGARVRVRGPVDEASLRSVLAALRS